MPYICWKEVVFGGYCDRESRSDALTPSSWFLEMPWKVQRALCTARRWILASSEQGRVLVEQRSRLFFSEFTLREKGGITSAF